MKQNLENSMTTNRNVE